jgi:RNase H-fold protein (predicted Holliday junction resolvase)
MDGTAILGLSFNTRMLGLAVIVGTQLVDYHIQLRKESWTSQKREVICASLQPWCERYSIKNIAMSIPYEKQTSKQTQELCEAFKSSLKENNIKLHRYPVKALYSICTEAKKTKKEVMRSLALRYPELGYPYQKEMRNKNKYYVKLFEAVGVATMHLQILRKE